ncbi:E3 ubiquitin-protein ligase TRIM71-like [Odocoileus virginianus]|uniref:E3 ubiquitin-protein ligase TRIM71-like n=1 Tax=Odocoileus virginianus TaxID=9874 RepID=A0ABM4IYP2_ODOVR
MSSMVLSSITESGSMAAPAAPPRSPRAAANGPGGGGDGGGGRGGGGSRTHSRCQPARAAGSSALPLGERSTQSEDYSSRQAPRGPAERCGNESPKAGHSAGCSKRNSVRKAALL